MDAQRGAAQAPASLGIPLFLSTVRPRCQPLDPGMSWASGKGTEETQATSIWPIKVPLCTAPPNVPVQLPQQPQASGGGTRG